MNRRIFYTAGHSDALNFAIEELKHKDCTFASTPDKTVTELILPVPSFQPDGTLKGGGRLVDLLETLSRNVTIYGGNLEGYMPAGYKTVDLLQDPLYLAQNADITAHCAIRIALNALPATLRDCHVLVIGWGRIGKCLAALLKNIGAIVTVAARKAQDRAMLAALGYDTQDANALNYELGRYRIIFNTAPFMVISKETVQHCQENCLKIDLASVPGIEGDDVIWARGLPNIYAPETSGRLIAQTVLRLGAP